jgi:hypothetical protein
VKPQSSISLRRSRFGSGAHYAHRSTGYKAEVSLNMPSDPNAILIEITDECGGMATRGLQGAPGSDTLHPPDELRAELEELQTHVARTRPPQLVAKRFGGDQRSPDSAIKWCALHFWRNVDLSNM